MVNITYFVHGTTTDNLLEKNKKLTTRMEIYS